MYLLLVPVFLLLNLVIFLALKFINSKRSPSKELLFIECFCTLKKKYKIMIKNEESTKKAKSK